MRQNLKSLLEAVAAVLAVAAPIICLFDCVVLPIAAVIAPFIGWSEILHGVSDQLITGLVLAICLPVLLPGLMKHRNKQVAVLLGLAASLMLFTNMLGENMDHGLHLLLTASTSVLLLRVNFLNKKLLACQCAHHKHG